MSQAPSTLGTITTSTRSPAWVTISVRSSSTHGLSSALTRVQIAASPKSISLQALTNSPRDASLRSTGTASSRLPRMMSADFAMSGAWAAIFSLEKSTKWIIREGPKGISATGSGAPMARGFMKSRGFLIGAKASFRGMDCEVRAAKVEDVGSIVPLYEWLLPPPGSKPSSWDPKRAAVALRDAIESRDSVVLLADEGGRLVGFLTAYQD